MYVFIKKKNLLSIFFIYEVNDYYMNSYYCKMKIDFINICIYYVFVYVYAYININNKQM